jgi:hypothetical protein
MLLNWFKKFQMFDKFDSMPEGIMAHEIRDQSLRSQIQHRYNELYRPEPTPFTHPQNFDPLTPPKGYAYDPYYECWIEVHDTR